MYIEELYLKDYKRLSNSNKEFTLKPKKKINIIVGSNGAGKSSLLKEILPNGENLKNEYDEEGLKILKITHNNKEYKISYEREDNKYSFIVDGTELNPSYNVKTYKSLIEEHFFLTKEIFELLLGLNNFSVMTTGERKKWFTEILSNTDYEYGLHLFNKVKTRVNDLNGMIKLINSKLLKEKELIKDYSEENIKIDKEALRYFKRLKQDILTNISKVGNLSLDESLELLKDSIQQFNKLDLKIDINKQELLDKLLVLNTKKQSLNTELENLDKEIKNINELIENTTRTVEIEKRFLELKEKLKNINTDLLKEYKLEIEDVKEIYEIFKNNYLQIVELVNSLKQYSDITTSVRTLPKLKEDYKTIKNKLTHLETIKNETDLNYNKLLVKKENTITCPKCGNIWTPNFDNDKFVSTKEMLKKINSEIEELRTKLEKLDEVISKLELRRSLLQELSSILSSNSGLFRLIKNIINETMEFEYDNVFIFLKKLKPEIEELYRDVDLVKEYEDLEKEIKVAKNIKLNNKDQLTKLLNNLYDKRINIIKELNKIEEEMKNLNNLKNKIENKDILLDNISNLLKDLSKTKRLAYQKLLNKYYYKYIDLIDDIILDLEDKLSDISIRKNRIDEYEKEKLELIERRKAAKSLHTALSPNKGLLAKGLINFINNVIEDINKVINEIFEYDLKILPVDLEEKKLDFVFPMLAKNTNKIPDISKGSGGMKEVIDLAFKLVVMNILGFEDYPLILDEFGRAMDPVHRKKAYDYINELSMSMFSQIFIISHNEDVFSRFNNADILLIDNLNYNIGK